MNKNGKNFLLAAILLVAIVIAAKSPELGQAWMQQVHKTEYTGYATFFICVLDLGGWAVIGLWITHRFQKDYYNGRGTMFGNG